MAHTFRALVKTDANAPAQVLERTDEDLSPGDVTVAVEFSTLNYKDGLALTAGTPVIRKFPLVPGIDLAGTVVASESASFAPGDRVLANGYGLGERFDGGYTERARLRSEWLVPIAESLTTHQAMQIGTAGYTAMLCVMALQTAGVEPGSGDVLVTGAAGGVGSVALALLARLGYRTVAATGRPEEQAYLQALGANEVIERQALGQAGKPLQSERYAAAVDVAGGQTLASVLSQMKYGGVVAACGLAHSADLPTTVLPFILRNVHLLGVDSVMAPHALRVEAWQRLARDLDRNKLEPMTQTVGLAELTDWAPRILAGKVRGRIVVDVNR